MQAAFPANWRVCFASAFTLSQLHTSSDFPNKLRIGCAFPVFPKRNGKDMECAEASLRSVEFGIWLFQLFKPPRRLGNQGSKDWRGVQSLYINCDFGSETFYNPVVETFNKIREGNNQWTDYDNDRFCKGFEELPAKKCGKHRRSISPKETMNPPLLGRTRL